MVGLTQTQKDLIAGSVGGMAQVLVGQPFDIVKVRVQTAAPGTFSSPLDCATKLLKNEGPLGFYKGTLTPLLGIGACVSIQFGALEWSKRFFASRNPGKELSLGELYVSGAIAGAANTIVAGPVEHIRIRLQTQPSNPRLYNGPLDCARKLYAQNGIAGVFKGQGSTICRDGFGYGFYFLTYEALVQRHIRKNGGSREDISPLWSLSYGAVAGYALWASIYPIDVVKSKLQTDSLDPAKRAYRSMADCFAKTWRAQGWRGFTGGLEPTLIRSPFANGVTFVAFELAMRVMGSKDKHEHPIMPDPTA